MATDDLSKGAQKGESKLSERKDFVEMNVADAPVKHIKWGAQQLETKSDPLHDPATGGGVVVRNFFIKAAPRQKGQAAPSKKKIIESFKQMMEISLFGDGLVPLDDKPVRLYTKRQLKPGLLRNKMISEGADMVIMVLAKPRMGVSLADKPQVLT